MNDDECSDDCRGVPGADEETRRTVDAHLSLLSDRRRRDLLYHLSTTDVTDVETLAEVLAAADRDVQPDEISPENREQIQVTLVHTHLPKLDRAGAVEFDSRTGAVRSRELPTKLRRLVEPCCAIEFEE